MLPELFECDMEEFFETCKLYADRNGLMISLETHNDKNVAFYEHFGFKIFGVVKKHFNLNQYCMVREKQSIQYT